MSEYTPNQLEVLDQHADGLLTAYETICRLMTYASMSARYAVQAVTGTFVSDDRAVTFIKALGHLYDADAKAIALLPEYVAWTDYGWADQGDGTPNNDRSVYA